MRVDISSSLSSSVLGNHKPSSHKGRSVKLSKGDTFVELLSIPNAVRSSL